MSERPLQQVATAEPIADSSFQQFAIRFHLEAPGASYLPPFACCAFAFSCWANCLIFAGASFMASTRSAVVIALSGCLALL